MILEAQHSNTFGIISDLPKSFFVMSNQGLQLSLDGHVFTKESTESDSIQWICAQSKTLECNVRARTARDKTRKLLHIQGFHSHKIITERRKSESIKALVEQRKKELEERRMRLSGVQ
uniref:(northern house mosquito) hypothetical protein n=1 Tax=Culex pipiens TaxID=7175 RepID=A0A8D8AHX3_CULPI